MTATAGPAPLAPSPPQERTARRERLAVLTHDPAFVVGFLLVCLWIACALLGRVIAPKDPAFTDILAKNQRPSGAHWFGTDRLGRDVFSRVIVGARSIVLISVGATVLGTALGTALGLVAGYFRGASDEIIMRVADAVLAIPVVVIGLLAVAAFDKPSGFVVALVIGIVFTPIIARTVRAAVLGEAQLDYVAAARLRNERTPHVLFVEILPNVAPPVIVEFTVRLGYAIFTVATLAFLGAGVSPDSPDWGSQVAQHYSFINGGVWWSSLFPALAIATLAVGVNLMADGLSEAFER